MEIEVIESKKNYLQFRLNGETHTFCNVLRAFLSEDKAVRRVAYNVEHPITHREKPVFEIETSGSRPPTALKRGAKKLAKTCDELRAEFEKALG